MRSIKPDAVRRQWERQGVVSIVFGIFWTVMAYNLTKDAPFPLVGTIFPLFGVLFVVIGIVQAVYHYKNATGRRRMSLLDIVEDGEEPDPIDAYIHRDDRGDRLHNHGTNSGADTDADVGIPFDGQRNFCPYCGSKVKMGFEFCPKCGKQL